MADLITSLFNAFLGPLVNAYGMMLEGFPLNILSYIVSALLLTFVMQAVFLLIPPLKSFVESIMFPFRIIHVWLHVHAAREVIENNEKAGNVGPNSLRFASYFTTGFNTKVEKSGMALTGICTPKEASKIANAPLKGALVMLAFLTLLTPFLRTTFIGKLIHLYIFVGVVTTSFPSASDQKFTYNMILVNSPISPTWVLMSAAAFTATFIIVIAWTESIIHAVVWGIAVTTVWTWVLLTTIIKRMELKAKNDPDSNINNYSSSETSFQSILTSADPYSNSSLLYQIENDL